MGGAFYRFFLSIGVALGLIAGQADPLLAARVLREGPIAGADSEVSLVAEAEIQRAYSKGSQELVESGSVVAVRVTAELVATGGRTWKAEATRTLAWDPRSKSYLVGIPAEARTIALDSVEAAMTLASRCPGLTLCPVSTLGSGGQVTLVASVGLIDAAGHWHEAPVLWNYVRPQQSYSFSSPRELPF
jgi:hypothetical protein